ncbi:ABC transporter substrate-binding protein [Leucobacter sp. M11]|uniref:ABC transporter substrate-binding protein n=1 Tax=Leucobacter sp. M11 TaxID=2993565 RepID=UPI002D7FFEAE|nr:ABC transporter substrate-binding protein [Leucobacter sp. M11]MEB4615260.1 ABC transporter substrate-binding protein [Leucobacter sp. M11]
MTRRTLISSGVAATALVFALTGCSSPTGAAEGGSGATADPATATSAADLGGMDALIAAAQEEGQLNIIARPDSWANYGKIIEGFEEKYDITVNSASPDVSSAEEIQAAENLKGQDTAPDVFDLGTAVALESTDSFAPYQVETWADIPAENKEPSGLWVNNYTGIMSIGVDTDKLTAPAALTDLLKDEYRGSVAINGDPTQAGAAFAAVGLISEQHGGSVADFGPGVDFVAALNAAGNFLTVDPTPATIASGETPVVFDWSFNNIAEQANKPSWKTVVLDGPSYVSFYNEAINKDAPNPAAARLWQEWILSDEVQNLYLEANAMPVRLAAMQDAGTADETLVDAAGLGSDPATWVTADAKETAAANTLLAERWPAAIR